MLHIREAVVVEGRYDKNALSQVVDTLILETAGFGIFKTGTRWPCCAGPPSAGG